MQISGAKAIQRTRNYGPIDNDFFWLKYPHHLEYQQSLQVTIYCSFDFKTFPFDYHNCDFNFGSVGNGMEKILLDSSKVRYKKQFVLFGQGLLRLDDTGLPFDVSIESLEPFDHFQAGFNYSFTGMRIHLSRNEFGQLIGGYYGPTFLCSLLSQISYAINTDMVCYF